MPTTDGRPASPATLLLEPGRGTMSGSTDRYEKRIADLEGLYRDEEAFAAVLRSSGEALAYWVETSIVEHGPGALSVGISTLLPGRVGEEFAMTRGHIHADPVHAELYYGLSGHGVMLLETTTGDTRALEITPGVAVHVPGHWIHRSVNTGNEPFSTLFCYATDAGQDYSVIGDAGGMRSLVVATGDGWALRDNPDHVGYRTGGEGR
jgi:glucose-6-phosphate isomerase